MSKPRAGWKVAFVAGAGSGIGRAVARRLAAAGSDLALFDARLGDEAHGAILEARAEPGQRVVTHQVDVTDPVALRAAVDAAVDELGPPGLVVHSAGINIARMFHEIGDADYDRVIDVNLKGSRNLAYAVLRHMQRGGHLVLLASMGGLVPNWGYAAYSASKFGVVGLAGVLRMECHPVGITVSVVCPPNVPTPMSEEEERTMHPVQRELKEMVGEVSVERVAEIIARAASRREFLVIPGFKAKLTYLLVKLTPLRLQHGLTNRTIDRILKVRGHPRPDWSKAVEGGEGEEGP
jgi:NAD(P)-dependent dehydrogenase (short-subunit alcohol dehydrogenase family)